MPDRRYNTVRSGSGVDTSKVLLLLFCGAALALVGFGPPARVAAQTGLYERFRSAAERWSVPIGILMAVGYAETRWEQQPGVVALDGGVGLMHLTTGDGGTLHRAIGLTGLTEQELRQDAGANITGAAAVLNDISQKHRTTKNAVDLWQSVLAEYMGASDPAVGLRYAHDVLKVWKEGRTETLSSGEVMVLTGDKGVDVSPAAEGPASEDYPPALWVPAYSGNYTNGRQYGPLSYIIIHDTEGSYYSAINWFQNPRAMVSAHYVIRSSDGQITQMVREANTAWHAGNWDYNVRSFGIEHEGYMSEPGWYTEAMYQASAALSRHLSSRYTLRKDRAFVVAHSEVPGSTHQDPGPYWDWNYYMSLVRRDWAYSDRIDNTHGGFSAVPPEIDPEHYWWTHGGGYGGSNAYVTMSVANSSNSINSGTWTSYISSAGYYDIYAFIPWVDNNNAETSSARYRVSAGDGEHLAIVSQRAITDRGTGGWAHLGKFYFDGVAPARVHLTDYTGESGRNVWFDAVMWIPVEGGPPPPPPPTATRTPVPGSTASPARTSTRVPTAPPTPTPGPTWTPGPCGMRFNDLPDSHWSYGYVAYLYCRGVIGGYQDGTFRPHVDSTRGQFVKMLALGFGWNLYTPMFPTFSDVQPGDVYFTYVETAHLRGVINGYEDGTFRPNNPVTRGQAAKMLVSARGWPPLYPTVPTFTDVLPTDWAYGYVEAAFSRGVIGGYADRTFRAHLHVTRSQIAKMLALTLQTQPQRGESVRP